MRVILPCIILGLAGAGTIITCDSVILACLIGAMLGLAAGVALFKLEMERDDAVREVDDIRTSTWWPR